ncbi:hypothetical protein Gotri_023916 [Gossypium trilobum]|uniref:Uncharacterized protein n=1 Tax=Gossypium trilobum TaxID=34281 RepID=A0A7J9DKQ0_9ROSI|nr:hypothetical protein [Gossypium trilobum]
MDKLKCFLCNGPYMLKKCLKKFEISKEERPIGKALGLGSSAKGIEAKEVENEKKPVECFLCYGKEPKKLGSSKGKVEAKRAKRSNNEAQFE